MDRARGYRIKCFSLVVGQDRVAVRIDFVAAHQMFLEYLFAIRHAPQFWRVRP
ncbi:MAG: hypothetical protein ACYCP0_02245 [Acidiferrobacteraceae bacterium]